MNIVVDIIVSLALYRPLGIAGLIIGTLAANVVMTALQMPSGCGSGSTGGWRGPRRR